MLALIDTLTALLDGRMSRAEANRWSHTLEPPHARTGGLFTALEATRVFDSIYDLGVMHGEEPMVRAEDLYAYLRWLREGQSFQEDGEALFVIEADIEDFAAQTETEAVRWLYQGLGWWVSVRFCTPASQRPFVAHAELARPGVLGFQKRRGDDWNESIVDLFEALGIDDKDTKYINPKIDVTTLPSWGLWREDDEGQHFEVARYRCYAKACARMAAFAAEDERYVYWVDPAG